MRNTWYRIIFTPVKKLIITCLLIYGLIWFSVSALAIDPVVDLQNQIDQLSTQLKMSQDATAPLESTLADLNRKIKSIQTQINTLRAQAQKEAQAISILEQSILAREVDLQVQQQLLANRVRNLYKRQRQNTLITILFSARDASSLTRQLIFGLSVAREDRAIISRISSQLSQLIADKAEASNRKAKYEAGQQKLNALQASLDREANFFSTEIAKAKDYQAKLSGQIAELTAKQQAILAEKTGTFQTTVGDVPLSSDPASRPDYNPGFSPAFAAFSFGAPHYKGMSQYGAYGRAKSGQSAEQILKAYYGNGIEIKKDYDPNIQINVSGYGSVDLETYTKRIYEMPASWGDHGGFEALKAQAVAARSYALARTNNGSGTICATESCQVYKPQNKGGKWEEAVNATRGWVLMANGQPFSAWYASTSGGFQESYTYNGYSTPSFWDTPSGRNGWTSQAWEKVAGSPWFYKGWYKSRSGNACGRSHPWLNPEELADILNAWVVLIQHGQADDRVTPQGGCWGGNPYSLSELRAKANSLGMGFSSVSSVSNVSYSNNGITASLTFQTNRGSVTLSGSEFKKAFNLRAPGNIAIKSGLFNIEKK